MNVGTVAKTVYALVTLPLLAGGVWALARADRQLHAAYPEGGEPSPSEHVDYLAHALHALGRDLEVNALSMGQRERMRMDMEYDARREAHDVG